MSRSYRFGAPSLSQKRRQGPIPTRVQGAKCPAWPSTGALASRRPAQADFLGPAEATGLQNRPVLLTRGSSSCPSQGLAPWQQPALACLPGHLAWEALPTPRPHPARACAAPAPGPALWNTLAAVVLTFSLVERECAAFGTQTIHLWSFYSPLKPAAQQSKKNMQVSTLPPKWCLSSALGSGGAQLCCPGVLSRPGVRVHAA